MQHLLADGPRRRAREGQLPPERLGPRGHHREGHLAKCLRAFGLVPPVASAAPGLLGDRHSACKDCSGARHRMRAAQHETRLHGGRRRDPLRHAPRRRRENGPALAGVARKRALRRVDAHRAVAHEAAGGGGRGDDTDLQPRRAAHLRRLSTGRARRVAQGQVFGLLAHEAAGARGAAADGRPRSRRRRPLGKRRLLRDGPSFVADGAAAQLNRCPPRDLRR
mmetsp:Transcript_87861/g.272092  ORF Transcript_87861/g.272092 Transcript_87861/m.272092 type:complete len:222 (+) Transcript_87861:172-837(+)